MYKLYIDGKLVEGKGAPIDVVNPATGEVVATINSASDEQCEEALQAAKRAFKTWQFSSIDERVGWLRKIQAACNERKEELLQLMILEMGRSRREAEGDYGTFNACCDYFAEEIKRVYDTVVPQCDTKRGGCTQYVYRRPLGVTVNHMAWNGTGWNMGTKMCPCLVSGCTGVFKPSSATPLFTLKVGEILAELGLPAGIVNFVYGGAGQVGKYLNESTIPSLISVIGSTRTGIEVMKQGATSVKHYSMELGGNAPCIFMPDADLDPAINWLVTRKTSGAGQSCANVNRIFVHEDIHDVFVDKLVAAVKAVPVSWGPDTPPVVCGPLINKKARDEKIAIVNQAVAEGAKLLYGGVIPELPDELKNGYYMIPAVLDGVTDDMTIASTELFGPIFQVLTFKDLDEVIERSNNTDYGLGGQVFTHDARVIARCVEELEHASLRFNLAGAGMNIPHVGMKGSGTGCVRSPWSLEEFFQIRCASIQA